MLTKQQKQCIADNPNLTKTQLAKFIGCTPQTVYNYRKKLGVKSNWSYSGKGIPFLSFSLSAVSYAVRYSNRQICRGTLRYCLEYVEKLIYCLEHNNGKLPNRPK